MEQLATIVFALGVISYSSASTLFFLDLVRWEGGEQRAPFAAGLLGAGAVFHATQMLISSLYTGVCPVESLHHALSLSALIAVACYFILRRRPTFHIVGVVVAPIALAFLLLTQFVGQNNLNAPGVPRSLLAFHVAANLFGVGLFLIAGAAGVFYLILERRLKGKQKSFGMPPLDQLDRTNHRLLLIGFPLLTAGVVTGALFGPQFSQGSGLEVSRSFFAYATWTVLATVLVLRHAAGWRGRRAAYGTLAGVGCVLLVIIVYAVRVYAGGVL